jgi:hypothetical protein
MHELLGDRLPLFVRADDDGRHAEVALAAEASHYPPEHEALGADQSDRKAPDDQQPGSRDTRSFVEKANDDDAQNRRGAPPKDAGVFLIPGEKMAAIVEAVGLKEGEPDRERPEHDARVELGAIVPKAKDLEV